MKVKQLIECEFLFICEKLVYVKKQNADNT